MHNNYHEGGRRGPIIHTARIQAVDHSRHIILIIPLLKNYLGTITFLSVISIVLFVPVFAGIRSWVQYKFFSRS